MERLVNLQKKYRSICLVIMLSSPLLFTLGMLGTRQDLYNADLAVATILFSFIVAIYGFIGAVVFRGRVRLAQAIQGELLAHWQFDPQRWLSFITWNRKKEKINSVIGLSYLSGAATIGGLTLIGLFSTESTLGPPLGIVLIAGVVFSIPLTNGWVLHLKTRRPEIYIALWSVCRRQPAPLCSTGSRLYDYRGEYP